jgi:ERCC4-related helicase
MKDSFVKDIETDKEFLEALLYEWEQVDSDPKLDVFVEKLSKLQKEQKDRKIVVFSQYASTINYLEKKLK